MPLMFVINHKIRLNTISKGKNVLWCETTVLSWNSANAGIYKTQDNNKELKLNDRIWFSVQVYVEGKKHGLAHMIKTGATTTCCKQDGDD